MNLIQHHYHNVVQQDLLLLEHSRTVSLIPSPKKISLFVVGETPQKADVICSLAVSKFITGQQPYITCQNLKKHKFSKSKEIMGGKITLRGLRMFEFWEKLLFEVLPYIKQFEGFNAPSHKKVFCFNLKDIFVFSELVPLFSYFENVKTIQCQYHFSTQDKSEAFVLGRSLQLCFNNFEK